jgi:threonine/homoserine/homoserine lactone efflux protein
VLADLVAFVGVSAVVICTPGQDTALTIRNALAGGRSSGIATAAGVSLGQAAWTVATAVGLASLLTASQPAFLALKLAGAFYLVLLGTQTLLRAVRGGERRLDVDLPARTSPRQSLRQGLLSNLANPKMALFFTALLPQFAPAGGAGLPVLLALGFLFCFLTFSWLAVYGLAVDAARGVLLRDRVRRALDAVTGLVLVGLGVRLAAARA